MKKYLSVIIVCILFITSMTVYSVSDENINLQPGYVIEFNGEATDYTSFICNNTHYLPMRIVFEKMGAYVYYRCSDHQILALSRDGDMIQHIVGDSIITVNGISKEFQRSFALDSGITYMSAEMLSAALCPDGISYDNEHINIQKQLYDSDYHKAVRDVLGISWNKTFHPERFQRYINYHRKMPEYSIDDVIIRVNLGLDYPFYENMEIIKEPYQLLVLVNKYNKLPEGFSQYNLVNMNRSYTVNDGKEYLLAEVANESYMQMADAARKEGLSMRVVSAYRTESYQRGLYNNKLRTTGRTNADNYSARPGHSEHQTGLAVDINSTRGSFEYSNEFKWLQKHAHEYGFILRYPKGKEWITGYSYEPWHYRYVGTEVAGIIYEEGITYEEFYNQYISVSEFR